MILVFMASVVAWRVLEDDLYRWGLVPSVEFAEVPMPEGQTYRDAAMWIARPDIQNNPAAWTPPNQAPAEAPRAAVFFIHPTSFLENRAWNAPLDDEDSQWRAGLFVRSQASAFNGVGRIWAPKYRQATFGAFLTEDQNATRALDFAYRDVVAAYDEFLQQIPADAPIILAGHSQGSFHLIRLLRERVQGSPEAARIAAAYVVGWPISLTADLPFLPLPACERAGQAGCILSWMSFGEPADVAGIVETWEASQGPTGLPRAGTSILCTNPLTGNVNDGAEREVNRGTLIPNEELTDAQFIAQAVGGRCDERGFLLLGAEPPEMGPYVLPGNNYHVYDYALFWANIRADADARLTTFMAR